MALRSNAKLTGTRSLKSKSSIKTGVKSLKSQPGKPSLQSKKQLAKAPKKHTIGWWKKEARKQFNRAVKYRDSSFKDGQWIFRCITCDNEVIFRDEEGHFKQTAHAGHFQPETRANTRFNEMNVNGQCNLCNSFNAGEQVKYARALDLKYGDGTALELEKEAHIPKQWTIPELQEIVADAREQIKWYESREKA